MGTRLFLDRVAPLSRVVLPLRPSVYVLVASPIDETEASAESMAERSLLAAQLKQRGIPSEWMHPTGFTSEMLLELCRGRRIPILVNRGFNPGMIRVRSVQGVSAVKQVDKEVRTYQLVATVLNLVAKQAKR
jgi:hypothetical protein